MSPALTSVRKHVNNFGDLTTTLWQAIGDLEEAIEAGIESSKKMSEAVASEKWVLPPGSERTPESDFMRQQFLEAMVVLHETWLEGWANLNDIADELGSQGIALSDNLGILRQHEEKVRQFLQDHNLDLDMEQEMESLRKHGDAESIDYDEVVRRAAMLVEGPIPNLPIEIAEHDLDAITQDEAESDDGTMPRLER